MFNKLLIKNGHIIIPVFMNIDEAISISKKKKIHKK